MDQRISPRRQGISRDLRASTVDGCCFSSMVGLGETWFIALFLAAGFGETTVAWLATLPVLAGSLFQLATPAATRWLGSWKKWVVVNASLQAISLILLAIAIGSGEASAFTLFLFASLYFGSGQATAPAWNLWIERLVPRTIRTAFLSRRQRWSQICLLGVVMLASVTLRLNESSGASPLIPLLAFLVCAGILRSVSAWCLSQQTEDARWLESPAPQPQAATESTPANPIRTRTFYQLLMFLVLMQCAVYISSAFFTPFKIRSLELNYAQFSFLVICSYVGKIMSLGLAGRLASRWGSFRLLLFGAIGIVPMAGLWSVSQNFAWLVTVQVFSGTMWACYELAMVMVFVELIPRGKRMRLLSQYNVANSIAMVAGTALGASLFVGLGQGYSAYLWVFAISSLVRLLTLAVFPFRLVTGPEGPGQTRGRFMLFSYSFELLGRAAFRPWQSVGNSEASARQRGSRAA